MRSIYIYIYIYNTAYTIYTVIMYVFTNPAEDTASEDSPGCINAKITFFYIDADILGDKLCFKDCITG